MFERFPSLVEVVARGERKEGEGTKEGGRKEVRTREAGGRGKKRDKGRNIRDREK